MTSASSRTRTQAARTAAAGRPLAPALPRPPHSVSLRTALGRFATGVCVITFRCHDGTVHGFTVNSFTSVSLTPPLVLISVAHSARAHDLLQGQPFAVNVLGAEQQQIAMHFAGGPQLVEIPWGESRGIACLDDAIARFACRPWRDYDAGDHTLCLGEVVGFDSRRGNALGYFHGRFVDIADQTMGLEYVL